MAAIFGFEILARDGRARCGRIHTPHGAFDTPAFMPVGTRAAVKGVSPTQLAGAGTQIVLANTYHLLLRPGPQIVHDLGGLQRLTNWNGPMLTDSGGFQVFSLAHLRALDDDGVRFRSHIDGAEIELTPESSIQTQNLLGADIIMCFDECPPLGKSDAIFAADAAAEDTTQLPPPAARAAVPTPPAKLAQAVRRTITWARRCKAAHARAGESPLGPPQALYGIVQGGLDLALRAHCLDQLVEIGFDGYALGGLSVGEPPPQMWELLEAFASKLPELQPRYLMGVGTPRDLVEGVAAGIDQFDCVLPTRNGRKGYAFTSAGVLRLRNARHRSSRAPLDEACDCECCRGFSRGYLRHLLTNDEMLGATLVSIHNLCYYQRLMQAMRAAISAGRFAAWRAEFLASPAARATADAPANVEDQDKEAE